MEPVDGDVVVVVEHDELAELLVAGERGGLAADALHHAAVAGEHVGVVVHDLGAERGGQEALGQGHAHAVGHALAQRPGGGLDAGGVAELGVAGRAAAPLTEGLEVVQAQVVAGEVQHGVEQHAGVARRQHEAVTVRPGGIGRVVAQMPREQRVGDARGAHGHAGVAGVGFLDAVDGQEADGVDTTFFEGQLAHGCPFVMRARPQASALPRRAGRAEAAAGRQLCFTRLRSTAR